jgi:Cu/Ag efflux protein CusF
MKRPACRPISALFASVLALAGACEEDLGPPDQTYTANGRIARMPDDVPGTAVHIHHEAIPEFVGRDGEVAGMHTMVMPFEPAEDLSLSKVAKGDAVRFTFEVRFDAKPMLRLTAIDKLPKSTELDLERSDEPEAGSGASKMDGHDMEGHDMEGHDMEGHD